MFQAILMSNVFKIVKKYWQAFAGIAAAIFLYIFKRNYDDKIKKETIKNIENVSRETSAREQAALSAVSEAVVISHASTPLPSNWQQLEQLSKETSKSTKAKAAKNKILRKLRRKD